MKSIHAPPRRRKFLSLLCWTVVFALAVATPILGGAIAVTALRQAGTAIAAQVAGPILAAIALVAKIALIFSAIFVTLNLAFVILATPPVLLPFGPAARLFEGLARMALDLS
jgi:hypothetical protein